MTRTLKKFKGRWNSGEWSELRQKQSLTLRMQSAACAEETVPAISRENPRWPCYWIPQNIYGGKKINTHKLVQKFRNISQII